MLRTIEEFKFSRRKERGNKIGAYFKDKKDNYEWLIKLINDLASVKEAFSGALFQLLVSAKHAPDTCLVKGMYPEDTKPSLMVASKILPGFLAFDMILADSSKQQLPENTEGVELVTIASALIRESDFYGNGNVGISNTPVTESKAFPALRIDFDDALTSSKIKDFAAYHFLGEILTDLAAPSLIQWRFLKKEKLWEAIKHLSQIDEKQIDALFLQFKPFFEAAIATEIKRFENEIAEKPLYAKHYQSLIDQTRLTLMQIELVLNDLKRDLKTMQKRLPSFQPQATSESSSTIITEFKEPGFFDIRNKLVAFCDLYDDFYTSFDAEFSKRFSLTLINDITTHGPTAASYKQFHLMKNRLLEIMNHAQCILSGLLQELECLNAKPTELPDYKATKAQTENNIAKYKQIVAQYKPFKLCVEAADLAIKSMLKLTADHVNNAIFSEDLDLLRILVAEGAPIDWATLTKNKNTPAIRMLVEAGLDTRSIYQQAINQNNKPLIELFLETQAPVDPEEICYAFYLGKQDIGSQLESTHMNSIQDIVNLLDHYDAMSLRRHQFFPSEKDKSFAQLSMFTRNLLDKLKHYSPVITDDEANRLIAVNVIYTTLKLTYDRIFTSSNKEQADAWINDCQQELKQLQLYYAATPVNFYEDALHVYLAESLSVLAPKMASTFSSTVSTVHASLFATPSAGSDKAPTQEPSTSATPSPSPTRRDEDKR